MQCVKCDSTNPPDAHFCNTCGTALILSTEAAPVQPTIQLEPAITSGTPLTSPPLNPLVAPTTPSAIPTPIAVAPINANVTVQAPSIIPAASPPIVVVAQNATNGPGCLVRSLYFLFIGLWFGLLWTGLAWFALVSVIGLPIGLVMLNRLPQVMTLKPVRKQTQVTVSGHTIVVGETNIQQRSFLIRALYFVFIGSWFSAVWLTTAWGLIAATGGLALPVSFWMFDRTPAIVTLARQ